MLKKMDFSNYANVQEHLKNNISEFIAEKKKLSLKDLDDETQSAIIYDLKSCFKITEKEVISIIKYCNFEVGESDLPEEYPFRVSYSFYIDENAKEKFNSKISVEYREILEENQVTMEAMDFITSEVEKYNLNIKRLLDTSIKDGKRSWQNLSYKIVSEIINFYNNCTVDLKTKKIVHYNVH
jgi:hypothetical protein